MKESIPTIFHVTHWKAGSQWIRKILTACAPELIVEPKLYERQFLQEPILAGRIYPTVYVTREQFYSVRLPQQWRRFIVIRDLRDTLVSAYFSIRFSHPLNEKVEEWRNILASMTLEEGMCYLMNEWLPSSAAIQRSWLKEESVFRYEDLLENDLEMLSDILLNKCGLPVSKETLEEAIIANRFSRLTHGRERGEEDIFAHERKGMPGDWRNYFDNKIKEQFKSKYGQLLIEAGYERNFNW